MKANHSQLCDIFGLTSQSFSKYLRLGMPCEAKGERGQANTYDTASVYRWLIQYELQKRVGEATGDVIDLDRERARLTRAQADNEEIKKRVNEKELLPRDDCVKGWCALVAAARSRILGTPARLVQRWPDMPKDCREELDELLREALDELSRSDPLGMDGAEGDDEDVGASAQA